MAKVRIFMIHKFLNISVSTLIFVTLHRVELNRVKHVKTELVYNGKLLYFLRKDYLTNTSAYTEGCLKPNKFINTNIFFMLVITLILYVLFFCFFLSEFIFNAFHIQSMILLLSSLCLRNAGF